MNLPVPHQGTVTACERGSEDGWHVHVRLDGHGRPGAVVAVEYVGILLLYGKWPDVRVAYRDSWIREWLLLERPFPERLRSALDKAVQVASRLNGQPVNVSEEQARDLVANQMDSVLHEARPIRRHP